jgi:hypothetical protein
MTTLHDGPEFTLPALFQYTGLPVLGQEVEVIYAEEAGQNVAHSVHAWRGGSD